MKLLLLLLAGFGSLLIGYVPTVRATDSVSLPATTTVPKQLVTVLVTHILPGATWWPNQALSCPVPNTGGSDIVNTSAPKSVRSFLAGPGSGVGYLVYQCEETYWNTSAYYLSLVNNTAVLCVPNPNPADGATETCSIKSDGYLIGYMPIHFVVKMPGQTIVRNTPMGGGSTYNRIGSASFNRAGSVLQVDSANVAIATFPTQLEFSTPNLAFGNHSLNILWDIYYTSSDGAGNGYVATNSAYAYCPSSATKYTFKLTDNMLGKTCEISCDQGGWYLEQLPWDPDPLIGLDPKGGYPASTFPNTMVHIASGVNNVTINCY